MNIKKVIRKFLSGVLVCCMFGNLAGSGTGLQTVKAAETRNSSWEAIRSVIGRYYGEWTDASYPGAETRYTPDTALMGNGDLGVHSGGNDYEKTFYLSKGSLWDYQATAHQIALGGYTIKSTDSKLPIPDDGNMAPSYKEITASSNDTWGHATLGKELAFSGELQKVPTGYGWVSRVMEEGAEPEWLQAEYENEITVKRYELYFDGAVRADGRPNNTRDFELQYSDDGLDWKVADHVTENTEDIYAKEFEEPIVAKFFRVVITQPVQPGTESPRARVAQLKLFATGEGETVPDDSPQHHEIQDILNAEVNTQITKDDAVLSMNTFTSAVNNVVVTKMTLEGLDQIELCVEPWVKGDNSKYPTNVIVNENNSITLSRQSGTPGNGVVVSKAAVTTTLIGCDFTSEKVDESKGKFVFLLEKNKPVYIVTAVEGGGRSFDESGAAQGEMPETLSKDLLQTIAKEEDIASLKEQHAAWWKDFWSASYIDLGTADPRLDMIQRYYYGAQYILGCTSREGKAAPGIMGIWCPTDNPMWENRYQLNYNYNAPFYGTNSSNRSELSLAAFDEILNYMPEGHRRAGNINEIKKIDATYVNQRIAEGTFPENGVPDGLLYSFAIGPDGITVGANGYQKEAMYAAYSAYLGGQYYQYTKDKTYLEEKLYPYLKACANFYSVWLEKDESGRYNIYSGYNEGSWALNPAIELGAMYSLYSNLVEASAALNKDEDARELWIDIRDNLAKQPTIEYQGKTVYALAEAERQADGSYAPMKSPIPADGNALPLELLLQGERLGYFSSSEELQIARNTIDVFGDGVWTQINNFPRIFPMAVRARYDIDEIINGYVSVISENMEPNLRISDGTHGIEKSGSTLAINEMLLLSDKGITKIFPNWYTDKDAKFANLRAKGAFTVSAEYDGTAQEAKNVTITSEAGEDMTLVSPWAEGMIVKDSQGNIVETTQGTVPNWEDQENATYTFATIAGETYTVEKGKTENEKPSKNTLEYFLNKAKEHRANGDVDNCVESIKNLFAEAIAGGEAVMVDENAAYDEVMDATVKLMKAIQALDMKAADKTDLEMAVELAQGIDLTKYVEAGQAEFQQALTAAQEVLADGDAMQADADTAWNALVDAISNLRLKADKSTLEDLLNSVADLDLSQYTEESAAVFRTALANVQAVLADETLSEDDQKTVDDAVQALSDAKDQLQLKDTSSGEGSDNIGDGSENTGSGDSQTPGSGDNSGNNGNSGSNNAGNSNAGNTNAKADAPKTGDTAPIMGMIMLGILSGAGILTISRKRVKE